MQIQDAYGGSAEERAQAMKSTMAKNDETITQIKSTFADAIETAKLVRVWRRVLSISIPLIVATINMNARGYTLDIGDWWNIFVMWCFANLLLSGISMLRWYNDLVDREFADTLVSVLIWHNRLIDLVATVEKKGNAVIGSWDDKFLEGAIRSYQRNLSAATALLRIRDWSGREDKAKLADVVLKASTSDLVKLLGGRPWLDRYLKMAQEL